MAAKNFGEVVAALRAMEGEPVVVWMRSSAGGDRLTIRDTLGVVEPFADQAVSVDVGSSGELILHFDQFKEGVVQDDGGVRVHYETGAVFRCVPAHEEEGAN